MKGPSASKSFFMKNLKVGCFTKKNRYELGIWEDRCIRTVPGIGIGGGYIRYSTPPSRHGFHITSFSRAGHTPIQESAHSRVLGLKGKIYVYEKLSGSVSRVLDLDPDSIASVDPDPESHLPT